MPTLLTPFPVDPVPYFAPSPVALYPRATSKLQESNVKLTLMVNSFSQMNYE